MMYRSRDRLVKNALLFSRPMIKCVKRAAQYLDLALLVLRVLDAAPNGRGWSVVVRCRLHNDVRQA
jgi:hypothetical protein